MSFLPESQPGLPRQRLSIPGGGAILGTGIITRWQPLPEFHIADELGLAGTPLLQVNPPAAIA